VARLAAQLWRCPAAVTTVAARVRAVDGTLVHEPGRTGSLWRVHFSLDLKTLRCDFFEVTDQHGGETFRRVPVAPGDLVLGDRAYGTPPGVNAVLAQGGEVLVRINLRRLPLYHASGRRRSILAKLRSLRRAAPQAWPAYVRGPAGLQAGRLVAIRRSRHAAQRAARRLRRKARREQHTLSAAAVEATRYLFVWTSLPADTYDAAAILELYRARWLIEIAIQRMKSLFGLGQLPKRAAVSARAWLHGKLFVALLVERLLDAAETLSPWGYALAASPQSLAGEPVLALGTGGGEPAAPGPETRVTPWGPNGP